MNKYKVVGILLVIASVGAMLSSMVLFGRSFYFADLTGNVSTAIIGSLFGVYSTYSTFKLVAESSYDAETDAPKINWQRPVKFVFFALLGTFVSLHFAGLSVSEFIVWIFSGFSL